MEENWKVFDIGTEAGRLLSRLYGVSTSSNRDNHNNNNNNHHHHHPCIQYPKFKTKKFDPNQQTWKVAGIGHNNNTNPFSSSNNKAKKKQIQVPRVGISKRNHYSSNKDTVAMIDIIPKRKNAHKCQEQLTQMEEMITAYRPPHHKCLAEKEKERLSHVFTYKGGSALPTELINPTGIMPDEEIWMKEENNRVECAKAKRRAQLSRSESLNYIKETISNKDQIDDQNSNDLNDILIQQITKEIDERRIFQRQMDEAKCGDKTRNKIANEISSRIIQLKKIKCLQGK